MPQVLPTKVPIKPLNRPPMARQEPISFQSGRQDFKQRVLLEVVQVPGHRRRVSAHLSQLLRQKPKIKVL